MSSHASHATRSARRASHPSDDSGDRRDGLSTPPLGLASASTPLALGQTSPPRRRIRPHSTTPWPARSVPAAPGPARPQSVLPRWCTSRSPFPNGPNFPAARPRCDSHSSASSDTPHLASDRCISARPPAPPSASWPAPASTTTSAGPRVPTPGSAPTPPPASTSAATRGGISLDPAAASWSTPASPPSRSGRACRATAARGSSRAPAPVGHAPDDRTLSHLLHPLQDLIDVAFPVHAMKQAWRRGGPCGPGRFPHHLTGLGDALEPFATFLRLRAHGVSCRPRPDLEPQDAKHRALLGSG